MPTSVALNSHFESFIQEQVKSGRYNNASEVVRAALRLMEEQRGIEAIQLEELRAAIARGLAGPAGKPADTILNRLEAKYQQRLNTTRTAKPRKAKA